MTLDHRPDRSTERFEPTTLGPSEPGSHEPGCLLDLALTLLRAGFSVVPPKQDGSKAPMSSWRQFQHRRPEESDLHVWYDPPPAMSERPTGIGIVCGKISGNLECLEFEGRTVADGIWADFKEAAKAVGLEPLLERIARGYGEWTPSGGLHLPFRVDAPVVPGNTRLASRPPTEAEIRAQGKAQPQVLIETRGEGGYVIVAPSHGGVHASGRPYRAITGSIEGIATITPEEMGLLHQLARTFDQMPRREAEEPAGTAPVEGELRPGDDFNQRALWDRDVLAPAGWSFTGTFGGRDHWYRNAGGRHGWTSATVTPDGRYLFVFSTSTEFEADRAYSRFGAYAILHFQGDFAAATKALREAGYGTPLPPVGVIIHGDGGPARLEEKPRGLTVLPADFWDARSVLGGIRDAANSRRVAPDAVLGSMLARAAAAVPHTLKLPAIVGIPAPLCLLVGTVGPSGLGKGVADGVGSELLPLDHRRVVADLPAGTGEGMAEALWGTVKDPESGAIERRQTKFNAYFFIDEVTTMAALMARNGSTLLATIRSIFSGSTIGQQNAAEERRRPVKRGNYAIGVNVCIQPEMAAPLFTEDEIVAGTPQRLLFFGTVNPTANSRLVGDIGGIRHYLYEHLDALWQGAENLTGAVITVPDRIRQEVLDDHDPALRGEVVRPRIEAHRNLVRLKVAGLLACLEGRWTLTEEDWQLATVVKATSDGIRDQLMQLMVKSAAKQEQERSDRQARRKVNETAQIEGWRTVEAAKRITDKVKATPGIVRGDVRGSLPRWRAEFNDGFDHALAQGWIHERPEPGQGTGKRALWPGRG